MTILAAAAAFAVLMIIFSTAVTGLTESYLRITSVRPKVLARSVLQFLKEDPTIQRFAKQSIDRYVPTMFENAINMVNAGKLLSGFDKVTLKALAAVRLNEIADQAEEWAREAQTEAVDARQAAEAAKGQDGHAELTAKADDAEKAAASTKEAAWAARNRAYNARTPPAAKQDQKTTGEAKTEDRQIVAAFDVLTLNHSLGEAMNWIHGLLKKIRGLLPIQEDFKRVEKITTYSFLQRLAKTEIGIEIAKSGEEAALRSLTMGFERYVAASNEIFRKHAQATTMVLSLVFALAFNIDAVRLFQHLMENPQFSNALIDQGEDAAEQNRATLTRFNETLTSLETAATAITVDPDKEEDLKSATELRAATEEVKAVVEAARKNLSEVSTDVDKLALDLELPIGGAQYPYSDRPCFIDAGKDCTNLAGEDIPRFLGWLLGVVLSGFLIGLGGPFWYRVFSSLSHLMQILRTVRGQPRQEAIEKDKADDQPASQKLVKTVLGGDTVNDGDLMRMFRASTGLPPSEFSGP